MIFALVDESKSARYISGKFGGIETALHNIISASKSGRSIFRSELNPKTSKAQQRVNIRAGSVVHAQHARYVIHTTVT